MVKASAGAGTGGPLTPHSGENSNLNCEILTVFLPKFVDDWAPPQIENDKHLVSFSCFKNWYKISEAKQPTQLYSYENNFSIYAL